MFRSRHKTSRVQTSDMNLPTSMMRAANEGNVERIRTLLHGGVSARCRVGHGSHGMIKHAAVNGEIEAVVVLLEAGADIDARGVDGSTALYFACIAFEPEMVDFLISNGASLVGPYCGTTLLMETMSMFLPCNVMDESKLKVVMSLLSAGQAVYGPSPYHSSALEEAVCAKHFSIPRPFQMRLLDLFLEFHVNVNEQDAYGRTALHHAAMLNDFDVIVCLLKAGVDVFTVDNYNLTAEDILVQSGGICEQRVDDWSVFAHPVQDFRGMLLLKEVALMVTKTWKMHQFSMGLHKRSFLSHVQVLSMEHIHHNFDVKAAETENEKEIESIVALQMVHRGGVG